MKIRKSYLGAVVVVATGFLSFTQTPSKVADVPSFHPTAPSPGVKLPALLPPDQLRDFKDLKPEYQRIVRAAYRTAPALSEVLYQAPCYCHCDRMVGHKSLRSCYETDHAMHCDTCLKELFYVAEMKKRRKSAEEIRAGIISGEWQKIDLNEATTQAEKDLVESKITP
jgi:Protein of unknown function with PCYCGC motif